MPSPSGGKLVSLNAVTATGAGSVMDFGGVPHLNYTMTVDVTGSPASVTVLLEGSLNKTTWFTITTMSAAAGGTVSASAAALYVRANLTALSGGASPTITATVTGIGSASVGGTMLSITAGPGATSPVALWQYTLPSGSGFVAPMRPFQFQTTITATDLSNAVAALGLDSNVTYGDATNGGSGTAHALTGDVLVNGNSNNLDEYAVLAGSVKMAGNPFPQATPGRMWLLDLRGHGSITVQPHLLSGSINFINNYYNGSPVKGSVGIEIATYPGVASGAPWNAALTYPLDVGIIVTGSAGDPAGTKNSRQGYTTGIRIGGSGFAWDAIPSSRIGTGLSILDHETAAINIGTPFAGSTATGINIAPASGTAYGIDTKGGTFTGAPIRLGNAQKIVARNAGDSGDIEVLQLNASSVVVIATAFRFTATGLGFYGTGAQTKQTVSGAKGSNAALGSLLTALSTLGLITDSTTA